MFHFFIFLFFRFFSFFQFHVVAFFFFFHVFLSFVFPYFLTSSFYYFFFVSFFTRPSRRPNRKKHRREVLLVKMTIFFCGNPIFGDGGLFEGDFAFMFFNSLFFVFLSEGLHCWRQYQSLSVAVSSVVGAPWRCGVVTT